MSYQVLARKYRPQKFSDVIGQDHVTKTLKNAIAQERIAHGYIFSGHRGIGKTTVARILAMSMNCRSAQKPVPEPCGVCDSCTEIRAGNSVDVIEIDAATNRGIDEIRELREAARYLPARDRYKIYILDEAHQITDAAFNALLKTLEEPPSHVVFMLATTQPEDIPQTIRSRCQHFSFRAVKFEDILGQLRDLARKENIPADEDALALLAEAGDGSIRDALSILDQAIASTADHLTLDSVRRLIGAAPATALEGVMQAVAQSSSEKILLLLDELIAEGHSPAHFARQLVRFLRNITVAKIAGKDSSLLQISEDERARAARVADLFSEEDLARHLQIMLRTHGELGYRQDQRFHLELGLLKMAHAQRLLPLEQLLSDVTPAASGTVRTSGRPVLAPPPEVRRTDAQAPSRSSSVSPFAADSARKNTPKPELASDMAATAARPGGAGGAGGTVVIMGSAAPAVSEIAAEPQAGPRSETGADSLRDVVLNALSNQPMLVSMLEAAEWSLEGNSLVAKVALSSTMIDMSFTADARRIA
ncbi:MAG: DNA polymerase III subunit gamma/tau, partial [Acidobacteriales bacterium]|nr:DNA polymerase III subunit gamma/tau [Terriglobales bacterium]